MSLRAISDEKSPSTVSGLGEKVKQRLLAFLSLYNIRINRPNISEITKHNRRQMPTPQTPPDLENTPDPLRTFLMSHPVPVSLSPFTALIGIFRGPLPQAGDQMARSAFQRNFPALKPVVRI